MKIPEDFSSPNETIKCVNCDSEISKNDWICPYCKTNPYQFVFIGATTEKQALELFHIVKNKPIKIANGGNSIHRIVNYSEYPGSYYFNTDTGLYFQLNDKNWRFVVEKKTNKNIELKITDLKVDQLVWSYSKLQERYTQSKIEMIDGRLNQVYVKNIPGVIDTREAYIYLNKEKIYSEKPKEMVKKVGYFIVEKNYEGSYTFLSKVIYDLEEAEESLSKNPGTILMKSEWEEEK